MFFKLLLQIAIRGFVIGLILFSIAGTFRWSAAWFFLAEMGILSIALGFWLSRYDPDLFAERLASFVQPEQKAWDRKLTFGMTVVSTVWFAVMAFDAGRWQISSMPVALHLVGAILLVVFIAIVKCVMMANRFAIPVAKIQTARAHAVASQGPYAFVRHPMYAATLLFYLGVPLLLGSWWGLVCTPFPIALLVSRTAREDRMLLDELPGYADYARKTLHRLIPFIW